MFIRGIDLSFFVVISLSGLGIRVTLALWNNLGNVPFSSVFRKTFGGIDSIFSPKYLL